MTQQITRRKFLQSACITISALTVNMSGLEKALAAASGSGPMATCDVLIIGSGGAGLRAAVAAMKKNPKLNVVVVTKCMPSRNATCMAEGGINGKKIELISYDNKGDDAEAINAFNREVDEGITAFIGDVITSNTIAVAGEANAVNMPMITASATAEAVTVNPDDGSVYTNVFRTCFIDPFQGEKMAQYAKEKLGYTKAAVIVQTGNDYAAGLNEAFKAKCAELGMTVVAEEGYAKGDKDFNAQLTNIKAADPEFIFCPNYYEDDGMIVKQARALGLTVPFLGGDGWDGVVKYASAEDLEGTFYCSAYAPGSTDAVKAFEEAYTAAYGTDTLNMFAANAYDAAMVMCAALAKAEETGEAPASDAYKQAVIDAIKTEGANVVGITSEAGYTFDANNNPIKDAVIMTITNGEAVYKETF